LPELSLGVSVAESLAAPAFVVITENSPPRFLTSEKRSGNRFESSHELRLRPGHIYCACFQQQEGVVIKPKKILAPTDLSGLSQPAVRHALEIGLEQGSEVIIYHVISEDGDWFGKDDRLNPASVLVPEQKERVREFVRENFADLIDKVRVTEVVEAGVPYNKIVTKAEEEHIDLIVMSTHGRTGLEQIMLGSVTAKVVARSSCPVLSIRPPK
jgi:nucleotide-binding universal stress UspA family protein